MKVFWKIGNNLEHFGNILGTFWEYENRRQAVPTQQAEDENTTYEQPVDVWPEWSSVATSVKINTSERRHRASSFSAEPAQHLRATPLSDNGRHAPAELRRWKREIRARHILSGGPGPKKTRHARRSVLKSDTLARKCDSKALLCGAVPPNAPTAAKAGYSSKIT